MKGKWARMDSLDKLVKETAMLDEFRYDQIVHFFGACVIPNHVMMVTEYAPSGRD